MSSHFGHKRKLTAQLGIFSATSSKYEKLLDIKPITNQSLLINLKFFVEKPQKIATTFETILNILMKAYLKSRFNYLSLSITTWKLALMAFVKDDLLNSACGRWFCFYWPEVVKKTKSRNHDWNFSYKPPYLHRKLDINCMTGFWMSRGILQLETKVTFFCSFGKYSYNYNNRAYQNMATPPFPEIMQNLLILGLFQLGLEVFKLRSRC